MKPIETVEVGDHVWALSRASGGLKRSRVSRVFGPMESALLDVACGSEQRGTQTITSTPEHPFWVEGRGWTAARSLKPGDRLKAADRGGGDLRVHGVANADARAEVFNFEVEGLHNYFVGPGVLVHNASKDPAAGNSSVSVRQPGASGYKVARAWSQEQIAATLTLRRETFAPYLDAGLEPSKRLGPYEADAHDPYSIHFGAFGDDGRAIGTIRLITPDLQPAATELSKIVASAADPVLTTKLMSTRAAVMPSVFTPEVAAALHKVNTFDQPLGEFSRIAVEPRARGGHLAFELVELAKRSAKALNLLLIASCAPRHVPMNVQRHGFTLLPGGPYIHPAMKVESAVIYQAAVVGKR